MISGKPSKRQVQRALDIHEEELGQYANVVGMGIVKLDAEDQQPDGCADVIAVYVRKKIPKAELLPQDVIPQHLEINVRGKGIMKVPTKVIEQGEVSLESPGKETL